MECASGPGVIAARAGALPGARRRCEAGKRTHGPGPRACLALLAATALLALAAPAQAQTEVWSTTLTPASLLNGLGCFNGVPNAECSNTSVLSEDSFTYDSTDYTVFQLFVSTDGSFSFIVDTIITAEIDALTLVVGSTSLVLADATTKPAQGRTWASSGVSLTAGTAVTVKLTAPGTTNTAAMGAPTITGTAQVGKTLTAVTTGITDADGLTSPTYTYQWIRVDGTDEEDISGENSSTYTLVDADLGKTIKVKVTFTDDASNAETLTSAATVTVAADTTPPEVESVTVSITGGDIFLNFDEGLDVDAGEALPYSAFSVTADGQALPANSLFIQGTELTVAVRLGTIKQGQTVVVSYPDPTAGDDTVALQDIAGNDVASFTTGMSGVPAVTNNSTNTAATGEPAITGTAQAGQELTADASLIMDTDGLTGVDFTYQWLRVDADGTSNEEDISGEILATYTLTNADVGKKVKVKVSFSDELRGPEMRTSAAYPSSGTVTAASTTAPALTSVMVTSTPRKTTDTYGAREHIEFSMTFDAPVTVTGDPTFAFDLGGPTTASWYAGSGTTTLRFSHAVTGGSMGDRDTNGISWAENAIALNGGTIAGTDNAVAAVLTHVAQSNLADHKVDGRTTAVTAATVTDVVVTSTPMLMASGSSTADTYGFGETIVITVTVSEAVEVEGDPVFRFSLTNPGSAANNPQATYDRTRSIATTIVFTYTVQAGDMDNNGIWIGDHSQTFLLDANDRIRTASQQIDIDRSHLEKGTQGGHKVDGSLGAPTVPPDPTAPTLVSATATTLTIEWTHPGDGGSPLTRNFIEYRVEGTTDWTNWYRGETPTPVTRTVITNLAAATAYDVRVHSTNAIGNSQWVQSATAFSTLAGTASCPVPTFAGRRKIWTGVLTMGDFTQMLPARSFRGYAVTPESGDGGGLDPVTFTLGLHDYEVGRIALLTSGASVLNFVAGQGQGVWWDSTVSALRLHVCNTNFDFSDSFWTYDSERGEDHIESSHRWDTDLDWSGVTTRTVHMSLPLNRPATGAPVITGPATVGQMLAVDVTGIEDEDGLHDIEYTYQWVRVDADGTSNEGDITDATADTYTLTDDDLGKKVKIEVSFSDDFGSDEQRTSAPTDTVTAVAMTTPGVTVSPTALTVTEEDTTGDSYTVVLNTEPTATVTVTVAGHAGTDVTPSPTSLTFTTSTWGTAQTVTVTAGDDADTANDAVSLTHSAASTDTDYDGISIDGVAVTVNDNDTAPATGAPTITGTAQVGQTLTAVTTGIMDADGLTSPTYTYQWIRVDGTDEADIASANSSTYILGDADLGTTLKVRVTFADDLGHTETLTSAATATVGAAATGPPTVTEVAVTSTPASGTTYYLADEVIEFTVTFSAPVTVTGTPTFAFRLGAATRQAAYASGSDSAALVFARTVQAGEVDRNGISWNALALALDGGTITQTGATTAARLTHAEQAPLEGHRVDAAPPMQVSASVQGLALVLVYDEPLDPASMPATGAYTVTATVGATATNPAVSEVSIYGIWVTLTLDAAPAAGATVTLAYAPPASNPVQDEAGNDAPAFSGQTVNGAAGNTAPTGAPTITGTAQVGQTLTAVTTGIMDADGLTSPTYTYQWIRVDGTEADIAGENSSTYTLVDADLGTTLKVKVTFADDLGHTETLTSAATATVGAAATAALGQVMGVGVAPGNAHLVVTWTAVDTATGYTVQWMSGSQGYNTGDRQAPVTSGSTTRYTIPSLTNGTEYTVQVIATRTGATDGPPSEEMTGTPRVPPPPPPPPPDLAQVTDVAVTSTPASGTTYYLAGEVIEFTVTFSAPVTVTATPKFAFRLGAATRQAAYASGSDSAALVFARTVQAGEVDRNGISWNALALALDGGTITQTGATTAARLTHAEQAPLEGHRVDAAPPMQVSASVQGLALVLVYDEPLDPASMPATGAYTVTATVGATATNPAVSEVSIYGIWVTLTLDAAPAAGATVTLAYAPPASNPVQDEAGNDAPAFSGQSVRLGPPPPPPDLAQVLGVGVAPGNAHLVVTWTAVDTATGYTVQWTSGSQGYNTTNRQATVTSGTTTSHTITGLANGTEYTVQVSATRTGATDGPPSAEVTGTPAVPTAAGITVSTTAVTVTEQDSTGDGYTVVLDTEPTADVVVTVAGHMGTDVTANPTTLTFTMSNWETAQTVTVTADDDADTTDDSVALTHSAASADSGYSGITIDGVAVTVNDNDTAQVTGVGVVPGNAQLVVTWTAVDTATGYTVQWTSGGQGYNTTNRQATVTSGTTTSHTITGLANGTEYTVQVSATRTGANDGPPSAEVTGTPTVPPPPPPPPPPPDLAQVMGVGVAPGNAHLVVTWTAVDTATGYTVQWMSGSQGYNTGDRQAPVTSGSTTRYTIPSLTNGTEYTVQVIATRTGATDGPPSAEMTGTPRVPPPPPPPPPDLAQVTDVAVTSTPASGTTYYLAGEVIEFTVTFSAPVTVTATPKFAFRLGAATRQAAYASGSDSAALVFARTVQAGEVDRNGISWNALALALDGGTITQTGATTAARLTHAAQAPLEGHRVDAAPPMQVSASVQGLALVLVYDEPLDPASMPATGAYTVTATVGATATHPAVSEVSIYGIWVTLTLDAAPAAGATVTLAYAPPASNPVQDEAGNDAPAFSGQTVNGAAGNTAPTGAPTITGTAQVGQTLTASTTGIADADGLTSPTYTYQWIRVNGTEADIAGENSSTYILVDADLGTTLKVRVTFADDLGHTETLTSAATATVVAAATAALGQVMGVGVAPGNAHLVVTWTAVDTATGYTVQWMSGSQGYNPGDRQAPVTSGSTTRYTIPSLTNGTAYTVRVIATRTGVTDGPPSAEMTGTPRVPPPPPPPPDLAQVLGVGVAPGNAHLVVTWTAVDTATGYTVQWTSGGQGYNTTNRQATVTSGSTTSHTITGLANGTEYTVQVSATRTGANDGPPSAEMTGTPRVPPPPPPPVTDLAQVLGVGVAPGNAQLVVTWTAVDTATGYTVQWMSGSQGYTTGDRQAPVTSGSPTRYTIPSLINGTAYTVRVIATRTGVTDGPPSAEVTATPVTTPGAPQDLRGEPGDAQVTLTWAAPASDGGSAILRYEYAVDDSGTWIDAGGDLEETVRDLTSGQSYAVAVRAVTAAGAGPATTVTSVPADPRPQAWLARFGRTATDHVVDAVSSRWHGGPQASHLTLGGPQAEALLGWTGLGGQAARDTAADRGDSVRTERASPRLFAPSGGAWPGVGGTGPGMTVAVTHRTTAPGGLGGVDRDAGAPLRGRAAPRALLDAWGLPDPRALTDLRAALMGSSFVYAGAQDDDGQARTPGWLGAWSAWGRGAASWFSGADGGASLEGEVATAMLGFDSRWGRWRAGVVASHSRGQGTYTPPTAPGGAVASSLTALHPYVGYDVNARTSVWGVVGYGVGEMSLTPARATTARETDLTNTMAAVGGRAALSVRSGRAGRFELALRSDARLTNTVADAVAGLVGATERTRRVRMMLEGAGTLPFALGGVLTPTVEAGLRYDTGDAETGAGLEVGGGLGYAVRRLAVTVNARGLLAHQDTAYEEWGFSGAMTYTPSADGRGLSMRLGSGWGATHSGVESLWSRQDAAALVRHAPVDAAQAYQLEVRYGLDGRQGRARWAPYLGVASGGGSRQALRLGVTLTAGRRLDAGLELGQRQGAPGADPEHAAQLRATLRW